MYIDAFYWSFSGECEKYTRTLQKIYHSKDTCTYIHVHIYLQEQNMRYLFKFSWSFFYGVYANCLALAILTLEVSQPTPLKKNLVPRFRKLSMETVCTLCWRNPKVDMITNFEMQGLTSRIM